MRLIWLKFCFGQVIERISICTATRTKASSSGSSSSSASHGTLELLLSAHGALRCLNATLLQDEPLSERLRKTMATE